MKIVFVLGLPNPFPGAAWTRISHLGNEWSEHNNSIEVIGTFTFNSLSKRGRTSVGKVSVFNIAFHIDLHNIFAFIFNVSNFFFCSIIYLLISKPKIVIITVPSGDAGLGAIIACKIFRIPYVIDYRDEWEDLEIEYSRGRIEKQFYSFIKRIAYYLYSESHQVVSVTPNICRVLANGGISDVKLIPNGADIKIFKPSVNKVPRKEFRLFYSGGVGGYYRLDIVGEAILRLINAGVTDVRLIIAGTGPVDNFINLANKIGIAKNIEYIGAITEKTELAEEMAQADLGLIPFDDNPLWKNALPAKFFEYCACGIPIIATVYTDSLLATLINEYEIGLVAPPLDAEKLGDIFYLIYHDRSFRLKAGKKARLLVEKEFDRSAIAIKYLNLVENIIKLKL